MNLLGWGAHWHRAFSPRFCGDSSTQGYYTVPCLEKLAPWATWSLLRYCANERINYLAQVTEFPLRVNGRDHRQCHPAGGWPSPCTPGLAIVPSVLFLATGIRRFGARRSILYEFAEKYTPRLLEGATLDFWPPIVLRGCGGDSGVDRGGRPFSP